ncbi:acyltransferase family protein [Dietzia kunjamensis]|uniref:acyltransferase family protein n=1 Tax=Dietzia kunjamensis TaxID=322509 RepID=UPI003365DA2F
MTSPRVDCFDALRLLAALAVVVGHSVTHLNTSFLWYDSGNGWWFQDGVIAFFVLSGLMVYRSGERCHERGQPWREYYRNRALRIIPAIYAYGLIIVLALAVVGEINFSNVTSVGVLAFIASIFALIPVYHPAQFADFGVGVVNGSLWTIPVEVSFYLVLPLIVLLMHRAGFKKGMAALAAIAAAGILIRSAGFAFAPDTMLVKLYGVTFLGWLWYFSLGIYWSRMWKRTPHHGGLALLCVALYVALAAWRYVVSEPEYGTLLAALAAIPLSYALIWFGNYGPRLFGHITNRIGDLSFGTYVWHMVVVNFLIYFGAREWPLPGTLKVSVVIFASLALGALSWHLVERPALARKKYSSVEVIKTEMDEARQSPSA